MKRILFYFNGVYSGGTEVEAVTLMKMLKGKYELYFTYYDTEGSFKNTIKKMNELAIYIPFDSNTTVDTIIFCTNATDHIKEIDNNFKHEKAYYWFHYYSGRQNEFARIALEGECNNIITVSEASNKKLSDFDFSKGKEEKIITINNIVDIQKIKDGGKENVDVDLNHTLNLVTIARIAPEKRFDRIIKIAQKLEEKNIDYQWIIIGKVNLQTCTDYERNIQDEFKKHPSIILIGETDNPYKYLAKADYSLLLSDRETWGLVITESKILEVPCVVTNFDASKEQIEDGKNGIVLDIKNEDYDTLVKRMLEDKKQLKDNIKGFEYDNESILEKWYKLL